MRLVVTMPVRDDWDCAFQICQMIDAVLREEPSLRAQILLVDDGSASGAPERLAPLELRAVESISLLELRRNLGHQRAICVALGYLHQRWQGDAVVVMDADGEDLPQHILSLVKASQKSGRPTAAFAERGKRLETAVFRAFYQGYRAMHRLLTGRDIRFGNFSLLPWSHLDTLVVFPELWNHYAATVLKSGLPYVRVRCDRAKRLAGRSRMNFVNLVIHGMSALFANQEIVGTRLLILILLATTGMSLGLGAVLGVKFFTRLAIPGWATVATGLLLVLLGQALVATFMLVFSIMMNRTQLGFLPVRDYAYFIRREATLFSR